MRRVIHSGAYGAAHRRERGVVAIIVALTLAVLAAFAGLALDLGKLYVAKTELSNVADACALAATHDLTKAVSLAAPEAAGMTVGSINRVVLQSENDLTMLPFSTRLPRESLNSVGGTNPTYS